MKVLRYIIAWSVFSLGVANGVWGAISFGGRTSGLIAQEGSQINLSGAVLADGVLCTSGGTFINDNASYANMTIAVRDGSDIATSVVDGDITLGSVIQLNNNQRLVLDGGSFNALVSIQSDLSQESVIQGYGSFDYGILVNQDKSLVMRWTSPLNVNIVTDPNATINLEEDLTFAPGKMFTGASMNLNFGNSRLCIGGSGDATTFVSSDQVWANAHVSLTGPLVINSQTITFTQERGFFNGNGHSVVLDTVSSILNGDDVGCVLTNILFKDVQGAFLQSDQSWPVNAVTFQAIDGQSLTITGGLGAGNSDIFGYEDGSVIFENGSIISLNNDCSFTSTWVMSGWVSCNGNSNILYLNDGTIELLNDVTFSDIIFSSVASGSFDNTGNHALFLSNITWISNNNQAIRITGLPNYSDGALCVLNNENASQGDIFSNRGTSWDGAHIECLNSIPLEAYWNVIEDGRIVVQGNGHVLDLHADDVSGGFGLGEDAVLILRDIILDNVGADSFQDNGITSYAQVQLSNVTVKLRETVDFSSLPINFIITGPVTFVTNEYTLTVNQESRIDGVTVYYDTLTPVDNRNVRGFTFDNDGRLLFVARVLQGSISIANTGTTYMYSTQYLSSTSGDVQGKEIEFTASGTVVYDGGDRSLVFPLTNDPVFSVSDQTVVRLQNIVLDGLLPEHLNIDGSLFFCDGSVIRLTQDWAVDRTFTFGTGLIASNESMIVDCNGFTIDMSHVDALFELRGTTNQRLRLCNGRLVGLSHHKLRANHDGSMIILENMELVLNTDDDYIFGENCAVTLSIEGRCMITGFYGRIFENKSYSDVIIRSGATLVLADSIVYKHRNNSVDSFVFEDSSSSLELIGSTFEFSNTTEGSLLLEKGKMIIDDLATLNVGDFGITLQDSLDVNIRPSATVTVTGAGTLLYGVDD